jgi:hypothetical protein
LSSEVEIHLVAYDEASSVIESVGSTLNAALMDMESQTEAFASTTDEVTGRVTSNYENIGAQSSQVSESYDEMATRARASADDINSSYGYVQDSAEKTTVSFGQQLLAVNNLATGSFGLVMSFERVENAQVAVDRANLMVERSTQSVKTAQDNYNKAIEKYGADSPQAQDAANKLTIAQTALEVAHERADMANRNMNTTMMTSVLTVIPSAISVISSLSAVKGILTSSTYIHAAAEYVEAAAETVATGATSILSGAMTALGGVLDFLAANPIVLVVAAIAAVILALKYAYDHSEAFRNIINAVGKVLSEFFTPIVQAVSGALTWLWNNVLVPLGKFIVSYFIGVWQDLCAIWGVLNTAITTVDNALSWLWNNVFVPLGKFIVSIFINTVLIPLKNMWDAISAGLTWLWHNVLEPIASFLSGAFKTAFDIIMVPINAFMSAINWLIGAAKTVSDFLGGLGKALMGLCFAHATPAAEAFNETLASSMELTDKLTGNVANLGNSLRGLTGVSAEAMPLMAGGIGAGAVSTPIVKAPVTVNISAPLVNVEGSADKATVEVAANQVMQQLKTVIVEATSSNAPSVQKRIRVGSVFS